MSSRLGISVFVPRLTPGAAPCVAAGLGNDVVRAYIWKTARKATKLCPKLCPDTGLGGTFFWAPASGMAQTVKPPAQYPVPGGPAHRS